LRRSRDRLKGEDIEDKKLALGTLRFVLSELSKVMAPVMPFYAEHLYLIVREEEEAESVHLSKWPVGGEIDDGLLKTMTEVRAVISEALELRTKANIKVRQPLQEVRVSEEVSVPDEFHEIIQDELNVKVVKCHNKLGVETGEYILTGQNVELNTEITPELQVEGDVRELMRAVQDLRKKNDLKAQDAIELTIQTDSSGQKVVETMKEMVQKTVGAEQILFADTDGVKVKAGERTFVLSLRKL